MRANEIMLDIIFNKARQILRKGKQVLVFVNTRSDTVTTGMAIMQKIKDSPGDFSLFESEISYRKKKDVERSRNAQIRELYDYGISIHNAGVLRPDRNLVESLFAGGYIKVLVSTSTLAWGVNLPAYAVIIKGTQIYDAAVQFFYNCVERRI